MKRNDGFESVRTHVNDQRNGREWKRIKKKSSDEILERWRSDLGHIANKGITENGVSRWTMHGIMGPSP
jgi:hypothetical protein